ncbi:hypothetical protein BGZ95_009733 [Linnemannia exigua]|uniref:Uncharacterized protein n=1 Tax=Linnemannia exigua TaxID=604196 RepID=A0AAD4DCN0_9FUNG|nr:hypothetical protein BGZ95_009733 [Linnemannia exigua]
MGKKLRDFFYSPFGRGMDIDRNAVAKCERDYDKIKFDVQHGPGSRCKLSSSEDDVVLHYVNESVFQWLKKMRQ